jgi:alkaline phosphatase
MRKYLSRAILTAAALSLALQAGAAKNVILMIGDGMGPEHVKAGSYYLTGAEGKLSFEPYFRCTVTTRSLDQAVTDSAASATTMATGHKTNNGVLSQSPDGSVVYETILERAKKMGKMTGLVTTAQISDATPAAFGAHEPARGNYANIVDDYLSSSTPNVIFGGGDPAKGNAGFFSAEQVERAKTLGYQFVDDITSMNALKPAVGEHVLGLFAGVCTTLEVNRKINCREPHLTQMTTKALSILEHDPDGFFLMVEGGEIDKAAHASNIAGVAGEAAEFGKAVGIVLKWMESNPDTLLLVTADHETGGLSVSPCAKGQIPTATWGSPGVHSNRNVPLYAAGPDASMLQWYIFDGVTDDTDLYRVMRKSLDKGPEPTLQSK